MKVLIADCCSSLVRLDYHVRTCECGQAGGRYLEDGLHAEYWGDETRMMGISNGEWREARNFPPVRPYQTDYTWFLIGHWPGCHIRKLDGPPPQ